jgi:GntR family transcriptional regulator, transcriptional repressor for pyruvate dehydrogenase complex
MADSSPRFDRIGATPAYQRVAAAIEREIVAGRIRPGEPIGTEAELARQFQVNRSTVREGIRLLEQDGLIERDSSRRLFVILPHYDGLATRISRALVLHEVTFLELFDASLAFETVVMDQAMVHATRQDIAALEINIAKTESVADDPVAIAALEAEFHTILARATANRILVLAGEPLKLLVAPTTELILAANLDLGGPRLLQAHRMYVDALRQRDAEAGRDWARRHLCDWRKGFEQVGKDLNQPVDRIYDRYRSQNGDGR